MDSVTCMLDFGMVVAIQIGEPQGISSRMPYRYAQNPRRSGIRPTGAADSADAGHSFFDHAATALRHIGEYTR